MKAKKNFTFVVHSFMLDLGLKKSELMLYALIYSYTNGGKGLFYGSQQTLAEQTGLSLRTVSRILKGFFERGLIEKTVLNGKKGIRCFKNQTVKPKADASSDSGGIKYDTDELLYRYKGYREVRVPKPKYDYLRLMDGEIAMTEEQLHKLLELVSDEVLYVYLKKLEIIIKRNDSEGNFLFPHNHYKIIKKWILEDYEV